MFKIIAKFFATKLLFSKLYAWLKPNFFIVLVPTFLIFMAFYIPYEYEKYLEFKLKFPNEQIGIYLNLARPSVIIFTFLFFLRFFYIQKQKIEQEHIERLAKIEMEKREKIEREQAALERLQEFRENKAVKVAETVATKENIGAAAGGIAGGLIGSSIGIAGFGTAIAGTFPVAIIGAAVGYFGIKLLKKLKNK